MKHLKSIIFFLSTFPLCAMQEAGLIKLLHQREMGLVGRVNFKKKFYTIQLKEIIDTTGFISTFPKEFLPKEGDSFEHNSLMEIVPKALADKDTDFKNALLTTFLEKEYATGEDLYWVVALVQAGADANLRVYQNFLSYNTPLKLIYDQPNVEYARALLKFGADPHLSLTKHAYRGVISLARTVKLVELLRSEDTGIAIKGGDHQTLLHEAAHRPNAEPELITYLIKNGLSVNDQDLWGSTPLHSLLERTYAHGEDNYSSEEIFEQKLKFLLTEDIDLSKKDNDGRDLEAAARHHTQHRSWLKVPEKIKNHKAYQDEAVRLRSILLD